MLPIRRILWPTDFSRLSKVALPVVRELTRHFDASLDVVHVLPDPPMMASIGASESVAGVAEYMESARARAESALDTLVKREIPEGFEVRTTTLRGSPAHAVTAFAEERDVDMIVISTHGETGLARFVFGSVTEKVVRLSRCLVLTVPSPPEEGAP